MIAISNHFCFWDIYRCSLFFQCTALFFSNTLFLLLLLLLILSSALIVTFHFATKWTCRKHIVGHLFLYKKGRRPVKPGLVQSQLNQHLSFWLVVCVCVCVCLDVSVSVGSIVFVCHAASIKIQLLNENHSDGQKVTDNGV